MYRPIIAALALVAFGGVANATTQVSKQRLDAIWAAVDDRVAQQTDIWFNDGDYPKSIHMLVFQATYEPHDYEAVTNLGWMQENVEDWDGALATYKLYWKNNPQDKDRGLPEADYLFREKRFAEVPPLLEPALKAKPHPDIFRILAHAYEKLNKLTDARRVWLQYIALAPNDGAAKRNLARVEKKLAATKTR
jgi:tetratricopeptide (TPR) repeat protein